MIVRLGNGRAVAGETLLALFVGFEDAIVNIGCVPFEPGEQRRAEVKADFRVVVDYVDDFFVWAEDS